MGGENAPARRRPGSSTDTRRSAPPTAWCSRSSSGKSIERISALRIQLTNRPMLDPPTRIRCRLFTGENLPLSQRVSAPAGYSNPSGSRKGASTTAVTHSPDEAAMTGSDAGNITATKLAITKVPLNMTCLLTGSIATRARDPTTRRGISYRNFETATPTGSLATASRSTVVNCRWRRSSASWSVCLVSET